MADLETSPAALTAYAQNLDGLHGAIDKINEYMRTQGCDTSGFTGLFVVLRPVVDMVGSLYDETLKFGHNRLNSMSAGIKAASEHYATVDATAAKRLADLMRELDEPSGMPTGVAPPGIGGSRSQSEPVY
ncbi:hypothetical protein [Amycolatopsis sp. H20-H5]|uniref:hypothetical protein n=1 Tax=Amycolatopsis sp. H20-H5 TaxID=3046309 RepID=UPI002DB9ABE2|nr:hypothetical protein [Amycolatopsis sp. H20-H5]MEC3980028.1 hypothetical protein [Amycolatopsis sp. H20-H5]